MAVLELIAGPGLGHLYELQPEGTVVGRHHDCDVMIDERKISCRHVWIYRDGNSYYAEDLNSSNGTYINEQRIEKAEAIADGDELRIHRTKFRFHEVAPAAVGDRPTTITGSIPARSYEFKYAENRPAEKLKAIVHLSKNLAHSVSLDDVLVAVLDTMFENFQQAERAFIMLPDADGELRMRSCKLRSDELFDVTSDRPVSRLVASTVMNSGEALLSLDSPSENQRAANEPEEEANIRAVICAPLVDSNGKPLGLIHLDTLQAHSSFDMDDLELLATASTIAGQRIENTTLHSERLNHEVAEHEQQLAREVQQLLVPHDEPSIEGYELFHDYEPARELGGDFIDYIHLPDGRIVIAVGDIAGKSVAAALLMSRLGAAFRMALRYENDLGKAATRVNQDLSEMEIPGRFVTCVLCLLDPSANKLSLVNAGHISPLIRRGNKTIERFPHDKHSTPLGVEANHEYQAIEWDFESGDALLVVTDGVCEAVNEDLEMYGDSRFESTLAAAPDTAAEIGKFLLADVRTYAGGQESTDNICIFILTRT